MRILTADYVLPVSAPVLHRGAVAIDGDKIAGVGERNDILARFPAADVSDFPAAAIMPGFVNCHSHLEVTALRGALDDAEHDFRSWLLKLNDLRREMSDEDILASALLGAKEGAAAGVTCFGDIGRFGHAGLNALKEAGLRGIVFQETEFSPDPRSAMEDLKALADKYDKLTAEASTLVSVGISPHSPYTVSSSLFEMIAQFSIINRVPLAIHAAESRSEMELLIEGTGFFNEVYEKFGVEWHSPHCTPIEYLERLGVLAARPLLAHCVHVSETDIERISAYGASIAHCPRSNSKFGHGIAPLARFVEKGITVGLGSDSVASSNSCDLIEESRTAAYLSRNRDPENGFLSGRQVIELATIGGARALRLGDQVGTLDVGKQADIAIVSLANEAQQPVHDVEAAIVFSSNARDVILTMVAGKIIYERPKG
jgi:5-methylthioadenosine/S-adenosylhomocysteine deaminase